MTRIVMKEVQKKAFGEPWLDKRWTKVESNLFVAELSDFGSEGLKDPWGKNILNSEIRTVHDREGEIIHFFIVVKNDGHLYMLKIFKGKHWMN